MALIGYARFHPRTNRRRTARRATQVRVYPHLRGNRLGREPRSAAARSSCSWSDPASWTGPSFTPPSLGPSRPWFWSGIRTSSTRSSPWLRGAWNGTVPRTSKRRKKGTMALARPRYSAVHCCESSPQQEQQTPQNRYSNTEIEGVTSSALPWRAFIHSLTQLQEPKLYSLEQERGFAGVAFFVKPPVTLCAVPKSNIAFVRGCPCRRDQASGIPSEVTATPPPASRGPHG